MIVLCLLPTRDGHYPYKSVTNIELIFTLTDDPIRITREPFALVNIERIVKEKTYMNMPIQFHQHPMDGCLWMLTKE